jgi:hypothetical protein
MTKSNGIASLKQAAKLLNKHAPDGESLAYINPKEARLLKSHGGSGIETLSGVPSYDHAWWHDLYQDYIAPTVGWIGENVFGYGDQTYTDPKDSSKTITRPGRSPFQDAIAVYAALRAKKDQEGLNAAEMSEFNRLNAQLTAGKQEFTEYTGGGEQLKAPEYVTTPKAVTRDIDFSGETTPDLTIEANAQGGRIGAFNGGIQGLIPQQGIPQQGMPQQGFMPQQGLDPRIGYAAQGGRIGFAEGPNMETLNWERESPYKSVASLFETESHPLDEQALAIFGKLFNQLNLLEQQVVSGGDQKAHGGRIGAQGGGIMPLLDMGGMEKDYRQDGGFVPIGRREKADDVPARLSKNEFVFTADAVKAAGGGDIDQGAQRMYNVMKNLEAGGEISEQSQGKA